MPHSSGGGSHSGGSHGGSHSSHGGSSSSIRTSSSYFPGATRYAYYHRGKIKYFYREKEYTDNDKNNSFLKFYLVIACIIYGFVIFSMMPGLFGITKKLDLNYDSKIYIEDTIHKLSSTDVDSIENSFEDFQNKTGITQPYS